MAVVFLARDVKHDRAVAIKVVRPEIAAALGPERFLREIEIAARLTHPHILPLLDSGDVDGVLYYVMPFIAGESLRDRLSRETQLPVEVALAITRQVASALAYAHTHDVVHRDIKPENILLQGDDVVVADFGIARAITAAGGERLTETGIALGTPAYMSPEQGLAERTVDGRSDIYSLACVLFEMLAGDPPYTGPTAQAILARRLHEPVPSLRVVRDTVPPGVEQAIGKALSRVAADRFATAMEFVEALARPRGETARRTPRLIAAAVAISVAAVGAWVLLHSSTAVKLDADLIAVAPFDVRGAGLATWGEGMVEYLSRSLDGAGALRTVSPSVFLRGWRGRADPAAATDLGKHTGARLVVFGSLVQGGRDSVRLRATLLDVGTGESQGQVEVAGDTLSIDRIADSLAVSLLNALGRTRPIAAVRTAPFGGAPLPALKEFLQGERFYRRSLYDSALVHHARAVALDSSFALAYRRMALELGWSPPTKGSFQSSNVYGVKAGSLNHGLTTRDSLLIAADSCLYGMDLVRGVDRLRLGQRGFALLAEAARRFPGDPEVWLELGEARYHAGLNTPAEALQAFDSVIALDSGFAPAYEHVVQLAMSTGGEELARRYTRPYLAQNVTDANTPSIRLAAALLDPARSHTPEVARLIDTVGIATLWRAAWEHLGAWTDSAETTVRLLRALPIGRRSLAGTESWFADTLMWPQYVVGALAYRGHVHEAWTAYQRVLAHPSSEWSAEFSSPLRDLALMKTIAGDTGGTAVFAKAAQAEGARSPTWLLWRFARRDTAALLRIVGEAERAARRAANSLQRARSDYVRLTAAGYVALLRGDSVTAQHRFEALSDSGCLQFDCTLEHLTLGRLLAGRGDDRRAAEVLDRWYPWAFGPTWVFTWLERARIAERLGDRGQAIRWYQFVRDAWRHADPELQPYVTEAQSGLRRLGAEPR